jgi:hypothetical protein|tara:strand:- start:1754 stop:2137 length:384 start_codon:yes stop_codon:yes gene_type:complete
MNFTQTFEEFSSGLGPTDLALYAGAGIVLWILFKDKLSPVQEAILKIVKGIKSKLGDIDLPTPSIPGLDEVAKTVPEDKQKLFFDLVVSWKQTRDLAERSGCNKAVEVADQMFPYLSPTICSEETDV